MEPSDLAAQLGVSPKSLRAWLRRTFPRSPLDHNTRWTVTHAQAEAARAHFTGSGPSAAAPAAVPTASRARSIRDTSDEAYVVDLCDEVLGERALRQHRFEWLLGDPGASGSRVRLPVDAYYPDHALVIEYRERQHSEPVPHFDKPDRMTVSGVHRGEQRALYDARREEQIPAHGLRLVVVSPADLESDARGRLRRDRDRDIEVLRRLLA